MISIKMNPIMSFLSNALFTIFILPTLAQASELAPTTSYSAAQEICYDIRSLIKKTDQLAIIEKPVESSEAAAINEAHEACLANNDESSCQETTAALNFINHNEACVNGDSEDSCRWIGRELMGLYQASRQLWFGINGLLQKFKTQHAPDLQHINFPRDILLIDEGDYNPEMTDGEKYLKLRIIAIEETEWYQRVEKIENSSELDYQKARKLTGNYITNDDSPIYPVKKELLFVLEELESLSQSDYCSN